MCTKNDRLKKKKKKKKSTRPHFKVLFFLNIWTNFEPFWSLSRTIPWNFYSYFFCSLKFKKMVYKFCNINSLLENNLWSRVGLMQGFWKSPHFPVLFIRISIQILSFCCSKFKQMVYNFCNFNSLLENNLWSRGGLMI